MVDKVKFNAIVRFHHKCFLGTLIYRGIPVSAPVFFEVGVCFNLTFWRNRMIKLMKFFKSKRDKRLLEITKRFDDVCHYVESNDFQVERAKNIFSNPGFCIDKVLNSNSNTNINLLIYRVFEYEKYLESSLKVISSFGDELKSFFDLTEDD